MADGQANNEPQSPTRPPSQTPGGDLDKTEAKFQLSFKTKVWEDIFDTPLNLWFAYTQQSHWQIYNKAHSAPFRETDYEPELILSFPLPSSWAWGDTRLRMGGLGLLHQSNGRANPYRAVGTGCTRWRRWIMARSPCRAAGGRVRRSPATTMTTRT